MNRRHLAMGLSKPLDLRCLPKGALGYMFADISNDAYITEVIKNTTKIHIVRAYPSTEEFLPNAVPI